MWMTVPATHPLLLRPPSPRLPPPSGSRTWRAAPLIARISHLTALLQPPLYPVSLKTHNNNNNLTPSSSFKRCEPLFFSQLVLYTKSLISLQQLCYENASLRAVVDMHTRWLASGLSVRLGRRSFAWAIGCCGINLNSKFSLNKSYQMTLSRHNKASVGFQWWNIPSCYCCYTSCVSVNRVMVQTVPQCGTLQPARDELSWSQLFSLFRI